MVKKFYQYLVEKLIQNEFDEKWVEVDYTDPVYQDIKATLSKTTEYSKPGIMYVAYVNNVDIDGSDKYYVVCIHGGKNGSGNWPNYFDDMEYLFSELFSNKGDCWLIDLVNDVPDDVWTMRFGFKPKQ